MALPAGALCRCPECGDGSVAAWVDRFGNVVWMCDEVGEVWQRPQDVETWPPYDRYSDRDVWRSWQGRDVDGLSLRRAELSEVPTEWWMSLPHPPSSRELVRSLGWAMDSLLNLVSIEVPGVDVRRGDELVAEHRCAEALDLVEQQVGRCGGALRPATAAFLAELRRAVATGEPALSEDFDLSTL